MRFPDWFGSVHYLFKKNNRKFLQRRRSEFLQKDHRQAEMLEQRKLLAFDLSAAFVVGNEPFSLGSVQVLDDSPQEMTLRFKPGTEIDPQSLGSGISIIRSGGNSDGFQEDNDPLNISNTRDVEVPLGAIVVDDYPSLNQVVIRFGETLPDDLYRVTISSEVTNGTVTDGLQEIVRDVDGNPTLREPFERGGENSFQFDFRVSTGATVVSVVPQPITRPSNYLPLTQATDTVVVYFDQAEALDQDSAGNTSFYRLFDVNQQTGEDLGGVFLPAAVEYDQFTHKATLRFSAPLANDSLFRLEIGETTPILQSAIGSVTILQPSPTPVPAAPIVNPIDVDNITLNARQVFSGIGQSGSTVTLLADLDEDGAPEVVVGTDLVAGNNTWSITPTGDLPEGKISFVVFQTDEDRQVSPATSGSFEVDRTAPAAPIVAPFLDPQKTTTPTVTGTGEPGTTVTITNGGAQIGVGPVGDDGTWSVVVGLQPEGFNQFTVVLTDTAGNESGASTVDITIDVTDPAQPALILSQPAWPFLRPPITGTGEAGNTIQVSGQLTFGGQFVILGTTVVTPILNTWRVVPLVDLPSNATIPLRIRQIDAAGNFTDLDTASSLDGPVQIITDDEAPTVLTIGDNEVQNSARPTISGTADALATVTLYADLNFDGTVNEAVGTVVGSTVADAAGLWTTNPEVDLPEGVINLRAYQVDQAGNAGTTPSDVGTVTVDLTVDPPTIDTLSVTNNQQPTITGTGEIGATVTVVADVDLDGTGSTEATIGTAIVQVDGTWSMESTATLQEGLIALSATQEDIATNVSAASDPGSIEIDLTATPPIFDVLPVTNLERPTISGTGEVGATVTVLADRDLDGTPEFPIGTAVVGGVDDTGASTRVASDGIEYDLVLNPQQSDNGAGTVTLESAVTLTAGIEISFQSESQFQGHVLGIVEDFGVVPGHFVADADNNDIGTVVVTPATLVAQGLQNFDENDATLNDSVAIIELVADFDFVNNAIATNDELRIGVRGVEARLTVEEPAAPTEEEPNPTFPITTFPVMSVDGIATVDGITVGMKLRSDSQEIADDFEVVAVDPVNNTVSVEDLSGGETPALLGVELGEKFSFYAISRASTDFDGSLGRMVSTVGVTSGMTAAGVDANGAAVSLITQESIDLLDPIDPNNDPAAIDANIAARNRQQSLAQNNIFKFVDALGQPDSSPNAQNVTFTLGGSVSFTSPPAEVLESVTEGTAVKLDSLTGISERVNVAPTAGTWSLVSSVILPEGVIALSATQIDEATNESDPSDPASIEIDLTVGALVIDALPATTNTTPTITGVGDSGATVVVLIDATNSGIADTVLGPTVVQPNGTWSVTSLATLPQGVLRIVAYQTDAAGTVSPTTTSSIEIDTTPPDAPVIDVLAATNDPTPTISGTGEASAIVTVRRLGVISSLASVQNAPAIILSADGNTAYVAEGTDGLQIIDVTNPVAAVVTNSVNTSGFASSVTLSPDGNTAYVATDAGLDIVDLINGPSVINTVARVGQPSGMTISPDGNTVYVADAGGLSSVGVFDVSDPGTAQVLTTLDLTDSEGNDVDVYDVTLSPDGDTAYIMAVDALHIFDVSDPAAVSELSTLVDPISTAGVGLSLSSDGNTVYAIWGDGSLRIIDVSEPALPSELNAVGVEGAGAVAISSDGDMAYVTGSGDRLSIINVSNPLTAAVTSTVNTSEGPDAVTLSNDGNTAYVTTGAGLDIIDSSGSILGTTSVGADGIWSFDSILPLEEGEIVFSAMQMDEAGNLSSSTAASIEIDLTILSPTIDLLAITNNSTPTLTGTGEVGATVTVVADVDLDGSGSAETEIGQVVVQGDGTWSLVSTEVLPEGTIALSATQTDQAGSISSPSAAASIEIDTTIQAPEFNVLTVTNNRRPTITGTGEAGAVVTVLADIDLDGVPESEITDPGNRPVVQSGGTWTFVSTVSLPEGDIALSATQTDEAGNVSAAGRFSSSLVFNSSTNGDWERAGQTLLGDVGQLFGNAVTVSGNGQRVAVASS